MKIFKNIYLLRQGCWSQRYFYISNFLIPLNWLAYLLLYEISCHYLGALHVGLYVLSVVSVADFPWLEQH